jgi:rare lipoprotein A
VACRIFKPSNGLGTHLPGLSVHNSLGIGFDAWFVIGELATEGIAKTVVGRASFYKSGDRTANGERFFPLGLTAAHRNLPFGTHILVTNIKNGKSVVVRINDRGPFFQGRVLDLSLGAARAIGLDSLGIGQIKFDEIPLSKP